LEKTEIKDNMVIPGGKIKDREGGDCLFSKGGVQTGKGGEKGKRSSNAAGAK